MIFKQIDEIVSGRKTQTRRIVKPGETTELALIPDYDTGIRPIIAVKSNGRIKWQVGRDYAVVPKRGKRAIIIDHEKGYDEWFIPEAFDTDKLYGSIVRDDHGLWHETKYCTLLRIRILSIRQERLQDITAEDAIAEGLHFDGTYYRYSTSNGMSSGYTDPRDAYTGLWNSINMRAGTRWRASLMVWVLSFEVVRS